MRANRFALILGLLPVFATVLPGQTLFVKPVKVLGDPHFIGTAGNPTATDSTGPNVVEGREVNQPTGIAVDTSASPPIVYIADTGNNRVLGFQYNTQLTPGSPADLILGQPDRFTNLAEGPGTNLSTGLHSPTGLAVDGAGNLYVADSGDNRILRYPKPFSQRPGYQFPDFIIGQPSFSGSTGNSGGIKATTLLLNNSLAGLAFDSSGNLWVADTGNNRVLRYPVSVLTANQNAPAADLAVGQADLVSNVGASSRTSKTGLSHPTSVSFDPAGRMLVADSLSRVLVYPSGAGTATPASRILGVVIATQSQPNPAPVSEINVGGISSAIASGSSIVVVDTAYNRILVYPGFDSWPTEANQFSPSATAVIGQNSFSDFKSNKGGESSAGSLSSPLYAALSGGELFISDSNNHRVLVFGSGGAGVSATAARVIGQTDFPFRAPNLVEGKEFNLAGGGSQPSGSAILDLTATPPHLYVADTQNNRILGFSDFQHVLNGQKADIVIGQPDFSRTTVNYPSNLPTTPNAQGLSGPSGLALDSAGNLYVADTFNSRILRFPAPFASGAKTLEAADLVIGQADFTSIVTDPTERTMSAPIALAFTQDGADASKSGSGFLIAADANHNRVLLFPKPFSNGMSATKIIGQTSFNSTSTSADVTRLASPRGVTIDPHDRVLVADSGNSRVQVYDRVQNLPDYFATPSFSLGGFSSPVAFAMATTGQFWVADSSNNQLTHYPSVDQLPLKNYAPDATHPAISPRSAFVDQYNNLLVADGVNRVLYFAPALGVVNAANYIAGRPLAAGTFAAVFPTGTNVLSSGSASAPSGVFPLPTAISDTQVLVNNNPASLFYVSPGQINFPLSLGLPTAGSVDLQVVRQSTGQVYGGAEVALNSASPGLFTLSGSGSAGVAAINQDGTVNSPTNAAVRTQVITLFGTGQGPVANPPDEGQAATGPVPTAVHPQILLGNPASAISVPDANIQYSGLAPTLVGVWQINVLLPANAPSGNNVPIKVLMNSIPSDNPSVPTQIAATIAIK